MPTMSSLNINRNGLMLLSQPSLLAHGFLMLMFMVVSACLASDWRIELYVLRFDELITPKVTEKCQKQLLQLANSWKFNWQRTTDISSPIYWQQTKGYNCTISKTSARFSSGFQTEEKTSETTRPQAEWFYCFRVFGNLMKPEARVFEDLWNYFSNKRIRSSYHFNKFSLFKYSFCGS